MGRRRGLELLGHRPREVREVDALLVQLYRSGVEPREVEEVDRELLQPIDLLGHGGEELVAGRLVELLVLQQLDEAAEREDRRAQLVRGVRDELPARAIDARQ